MASQQARKLVIVESPAKAKTISQFLGSEYRIEASMGHVRDLPASADQIPEAVKGQPWARIGVNIEKGFEPLYIVPPEKKRVVAALKEAESANLVAGNIQHIFAVTEQTGEGTRSTADQVRELSRIAEELRQSVARFKIA